MLLCSQQLLDSKNIVTQSFIFHNLKHVSKKAFQVFMKCAHSYFKNKSEKFEFRGVKYRARVA